MIGRQTAIEVKSTKKIDSKHLKGLKDENIFKQLIVVFHDPIPHQSDSIQFIPIEYILKRLWGDRIF